MQVHRVLEVYREALAALEDPQMAEGCHATESDVEVGKRGSVWLGIFLWCEADQRRGVTQSYTLTSPDPSLRIGRHDDRPDPAYCNDTVSHSELP